MAVRASGYTVTSIGPNQEMTPEGFLLCKDVAVARTGVMVYGPDETPIEAGQDGIARVYREAEDLFNDLTIASAVGKSITNDHPDDGVDVQPDNWKELTHGIGLNVRRGVGAEDDLMFMDLLFTTEEGIRLVKDGKREISLGYDADYTQIEPGKGKQSNIIINHIALVERGRCGQRCAIKDKQSIKPEADAMATNARTKKTKDKQGFAKIMNLIFRANKARDAEELAEIVNEAAQDDEFMEGKNAAQDDEFGSNSGEGGDTHIHIHNNGEKSGETADDDLNEGGRARFDDDALQEHIDKNELEHNEMRARLDALEAKIGKGADNANAEEGEVLDGGEELEEFLEEEAPEGIEASDARKARDSRYLGESLKNTIAMAEILAPGIRFPTYDRTANPAKTAKAICNLRRKALDQAFAQPENAAFIRDIIGGKTLDTKNMSCGAVRTLFRSAAAIKRQANNGAGVRDSIANLQAAQKTAGKPKTIEEIQKANEEYYSQKK